MTILDDLRFWSILLAEDRRTVICSPENESRVKCAGVTDVLVSRYVPDDQILIVREVS